MRSCATTPDSLPALDLVALGELLVDFVPTASGLEFERAATYVRAAGGAPANVAVGLARLGRRVGFLGKVGDDPFGRYLAGVLAAEGVDVTQLKSDPAARTALAFVTLRADGEREFLFYRHPSADMLHRPDEVDPAYLGRARSFHFGSFTLSAGSAREATRHAVGVARAAGLLVSFDANLRLAVWSGAADALREVRWAAGQAHVVKLSEEELIFLAGGTDERAARAIMTEGTRLLVVTRGAAGADFFTPELSGTVPGLRVSPVDTTGAGDAFTAALLSRLLEHGGVPGTQAELAAAVRFANAAGALATTQRGAIPAMPSASAVMRLLGGADG